MSAKQVRACDRVLYLTYDGLLDPLGQSQILPYMEGLARAGYDITVISFEKPDRYRAQGESLRRRCDQSGIRWHGLRYHKRWSSAATLWDQVRCLVLAARLRNHFDFVHLRSYALGPVALILKTVLNRPFIFDMRGLWVEERIDGGLWRRNSLVARIGKLAESRLLRNAFHTVTLTDSSIPTLLRLAPNLAPESITVLPTCVDTATFEPAQPSEQSQQLTFCYHGSLGTWYDDELLTSWTALVTAMGHHMIVLTNDLKHESIEHLVLAGARVTTANYAQVPDILRAVDASVFFIHPRPSKVASMPTKFAEALAMGLPVLTNSGVGDLDEIITSQRVGVVLEGDDESSLKAGLSELEDLLISESTRLRCRELAVSRFSLDEGIKRYETIYKEFHCE